MDTRQTIYAGDTSDTWEIGLVTSGEGVAPAELATLDGNFTCWLEVKDAAPAIRREISLRNGATTRFLAWLTPAETLALGRGTWQVGLELRNPTLQPPLVREVHRAVVIQPALVAPS